MLLLYMQSHIFLNGIKQMKPNQKRVYLCILRTYIFVRVVLCYLQTHKSMNIRNLLITITKFCQFLEFFSLQDIT